MYSSVPQELMIKWLEIKRQLQKARYKLSLKKSAVMVSWFIGIEFQDVEPVMEKAILVSSSGIQRL